MAVEKSDNLNPDDVHVELMKAIVRSVSSTPYVLKGGTALLLGYGLDRHSEDIDFDSPKKLNILNKALSSIPRGVEIISHSTPKNTETVARHVLKYKSAAGNGSLKIESSFRGGGIGEFRILDGMRVASLPRLVDNKLRAAFDSETFARDAVRDLYDLHFLSKEYPASFSSRDILRLEAFSANPDDLYRRYEEVYEEDNIVRNKVSLEELCIEVHDRAREIKANHNILHQKTLAVSRSFSEGPVGDIFHKVVNEFSAEHKLTLPEYPWNEIGKKTIDRSLERGIDDLDVRTFLASHSPLSALPSYNAKLGFEVTPGVKASAEIVDEPSAASPPSPAGPRP